MKLLYSGFLMHILYKCDIGKMLGFEVDSGERILQTSLVQKGGVIIGQGQDPWTERTALGL